MKSDALKDKKIAILVTDGFEEVELTKPLKAFANAGALVEIVSPKEQDVWSYVHNKQGSLFPVDVPLSEALSLDYDALVLPGGVMNPDKLRQDSSVLAFVKSFFMNGKPVAAICHGPWTLIDAGVIDGKTVTSYPSLKTDIENAGGTWVDREVVVDNGLITSRTPDDLDAFIEKTIEEIREGKHMYQFA